MVRRSTSLALFGLLAGACADDGADPAAGAPGSESSSDAEIGDDDPGPETGTSGPEGETGADTDPGEGETETGEPPEPICATPLADAITGEAIAGHLGAFYELALANGGNRAAGTDGYEASAAYVEAQLAEAGYATSRWPFEFDRYVVLGPPTLATLSDSPTVYQVTVDYDVPNWSPAGEVEAVIEAVDLALGLGNTSTSGCEPEDFAGFTPGRVALIQRGSCTFASKAANAEAAGAVATIIFNQGDTEARQGLFAGSLGSQSGLGAPVLFATYAVGVELADAAALEPTSVAITVDAEVVATETFNVIAETPGGDPDRVVMLGAHLDSVPAGPGVNDNGSGSATILEVARQLAACAPNYKVRFAWWGAEEWGLHGSREWVAALSDDELERLALYLNFDMLASPNYVRYVHHGADGPEGSTLLYDAFAEWYTQADLAITGASFSGRSDYQPFVDAGVPASGLATGANGAKSEAEAETYGGVAGQPYDLCYHQHCDDQANFDLEVLGHNGKATAHVIERWARDLGPLRAQPKIVREPLAGELAGPTHDCGEAHE